MKEKNLDVFKQQIKMISSARHTWTIGVNHAPDGIHYYLSIENRRDPINVIELKPTKKDKDLHMVRLHPENYDMKNMTGLDAGELAAALQLSTIMLMSLDYGYMPKGGNAVRSQ